MALKFRYRPTGWVPDPPAPSGELVEFSNPKTDFILGPQVTVTDTDVSGEYIQTDRVPWPWMEKNGLKKNDDSYAGWYLAEHCVTAPGDAPNSRGTVREALSSGATVIDLVDYVTTGRFKVPTAGYYLYFDGGATAQIQSIATHRIFTIGAGLSAAVAEGETYTSSNGASGSAESAASSGGTSIDLSFGGSAPAVGNTLTFSGGATGVVTAREGPHLELTLESPGLTAAVAADEGYTAIDEPYPPSRPAADTCSYFDLTGDHGSNYYYDLGWAFWTHYYRTGDTYWRDKAVAVTKAWFGRAYNSGDNTVDYRALPPRQMAMGGLILTAIYEDETLTGDAQDGTSLIWDWVYESIFDTFKIWVWTKYTAGGESGGVRDPGYALLHAAQISGVLPDQYECTHAHEGFTVGQTVTTGAEKRSTLASQVAAVIAGEPGGTIGVDGHFNCYMDPDGTIRQGLEGDAVGVLSCQPWHIGIMSEGYIQTIKLLETYFPGEYDDQIADAEAAIVRMANYIWWSMRKNNTERGRIANSSPVRYWRATAYITHGPLHGAEIQMDGTVDLTVNTGSGTTTFAGTDTLFADDGLYAECEFHLRDDITGSITVNADRTVVGDGSFDFTALVPGVLLNVEKDDGDHERVRVESVTDATNLTLVETPSSEIIGSGRVAWRMPVEILSGQGHIDQATIVGGSKAAQGTLVGNVSAAYLTELQVGDHLIVYSDSGVADAWLVTAVTDDQHADVRSLATPHDQWFTDRVIGRASRPGEKRGPFRVVSVASNTSMVGDFEYPAADLTDRRIFLRTSGQKNASGNWGGSAATQDVHNKRQTNCENMLVMYWLYHRTGNTEYLTRGNEIMAATWGHGEGLDADEYSGGMNDYFLDISSVGRGKEYNQGHRWAGRSLGYRAGGS